MTAEWKSFLLDGKRWMRLISIPHTSQRPGLFLDRDGVMIEEREYLADPTGVELIPGCSNLIRHARTRGIAVVVITNQSGIGHGFFTWHDYALVENRLIEMLARNGAVVDAVLANSAAPGEGDPVHNWRKPQPGMPITAAAALNIALERSVVVGDKASDLAAGRAAGLHLGIHVATGHGRSEVEAARQLPTAQFRVNCLRSIADVRASLDALAFGE